MTQINNSPKWFRNIAIIALIWNILGLMAFIAHMMTTPEMIAALPANEQLLYQNVPMWATAVFALAVFAGTLGCVFLLLKKSLAKMLFIASTFGILLQNFHSFFIIDSMGVYGATSVIMPLFVFIISIGLILLTNKAQENSWIS